MYRYVHRNRANLQKNGAVVIPLDVEEGCEEEFSQDHGHPIPKGAFVKDGFYELEVPGRWEICSRCDGNGTHTNPSIDGNGLTAEDFDDWDEDMIEGYFRGRYDVRCEAGCHGGKVRVPNVDVADVEVRWWIKRYFEREGERADEGRADARTCWYEDGCPMD